MPSDFEQQLEQMIPLVRESFVCRTAPKTMQREVQTKSFAKIALGFALGVFVTYHVMLPNDSPPQAPAKTYTVKFDESALQHVRSPADIFRCAVRVPVAEDKPAHGQYSVLRNQLLQSSTPPS